LTSLVTLPVRYLRWSAVSLPTTPTRSNRRRAVREDRPYAIGGSLGRVTPTRPTTPRIRLNTTSAQTTQITELAVPRPGRPAMAWPRSYRGAGAAWSLRDVLLRDLGYRSRPSSSGPRSLFATSDVRHHLRAVPVLDRAVHWITQTSSLPSATAHIGTTVTPFFIALLPSR